MNGELMERGQGGDLATQFQQDRAVAQVQAEMQSMMMWAVKYPRDEATALVAIEEQCDDADSADSFTYELERKNYRTGEVKVIRGLSIDMAEEVMRQWKNIIVNTQLISDTPDGMLLDVVVYDLERNNRSSEPVYVTKTVERSKLKDGEVAIAERTGSRGNKVYIVKASDDDMRTKMLSLTHKAKRNQILSVVSKVAQGRLLDKCFKTLEAEAERKAKTEEGRAAMLKSFGDVGVDKKALETFLGHAFDKISPEEWLHLRGIYKAITKEGLTWEQAIDQEEAPKPEKKLDPTDGRQKFQGNKPPPETDTQQFGFTEEQESQEEKPVPPMPKLAESVYKAFTLQCEKLELSQDFQDAASDQLFIWCDTRTWADFKTKDVVTKALRWITEAMSDWCQEQR